MTTKKGEMKPQQFEEFDPAPIMPGPGVRVVDDNVDLGSKSMVPNGKVRNKVVLEDEEEIKETPDPFAPIIKRVLRSASPAVKSAIKGTDCFSRCWHDDEDNSYCPEIDCDLRQLCETTYHQVMGNVVPEPEEESEEISEEEAKQAAKVLKKQEARSRGDLYQNKKKRKLQGKKAKKAKAKKKPQSGRPRSAWEAEKYKPRMYVSTERPVDDFAKTIFDGINSPPELTENWRYGNSKTLDDRISAQKKFKDKFGHHTLIVRRSGYHMVIHDGLHVFRMWVNAAGGGWVDMNPVLAERIKQEIGLFEIFDTPAKNKRHNFQFFTERCWIGSNEQSAVFAGIVNEVLDRLRAR